MSFFRPPQAEVVLTGSVTYRCASCGGDIDGPVSWFDPTWEVPSDIAWLEGPPPLTSQTKTYHPSHLPVTED